MGCPGTSSFPSGVGNVRIGAVTWAAGYRYPKVYGGYFSSSDYDSASGGGNPSGLQGASDSCSCLCSGLGSGKIPYYYQYVRESTYTTYDDTWDSGYYPGGSTGIYARSNSTKQWYFNIGQSQRCGQIYTGLYQLSPSNSMDLITYNISWATLGRLDVSFEWYLFGTEPSYGFFPQPWYFGKAPGANPGGFDFISLCISNFNLGNTDGDGCPMSSCLNPQDYGLGIPSNAIVGGHDLIAGCPPTSTVWDSCQDSDCSPNGKCQGPPSFAGPTGCISNNSILNGNDLNTNSVPINNGCFDCEGKAIFHPCYNSGNNNTTLWNSAGNVWESPRGIGATAIYGMAGYDLAFTYGGCETMGTGGNELNSPYDYNPTVTDSWHGDAFMQSKDWDTCCNYAQFGCPDPTFANFNAATTGSYGLDCVGNPDPDTMKSWNLSTSQFDCEHVSWVNGGATTYNYTDSSGIAQTATQPGPGMVVPCSSLISNGVANQGGHPLAWSKTNYTTADSCCCSNAGCTDNGQGPLAPWLSPSVPSLDRYTLPWSSANGVNDVPYYPGYDVMVGTTSPVNITSGPAAASNFCATCIEDCNNQAPGTYGTGWADCCEYQILGCTDNSAGPNEDIFGNPTPTYTVWNFNPLANVDDGSCFYEEPITGCLDDGGLGLSVIGLPAFSSYQYAGIPANNYNPQANINDGSCTFDYGCPDLYALNYDECADPNNYTAIASGLLTSCFSSNITPEWISATYNLNNFASVPDLSVCLYDIPGAGPGCMDPQAINYNPLATTDCSDNTGTAPYPSDFGCCTYPTEGCTDPNAWNYNLLAMIDDGSCEYVIRPFQDEVNFLNGTPVLLCREPITKEEALMNVAEPPEIQSEIFIERGKQSVMEPNQRLGEIRTMGGLVNYAYGYYKIKEQ